MYWAAQSTRMSSAHWVRSFQRADPLALVAAITTSPTPVS